MPDSSLLHSLISLLASPTSATGTTGWARTCPGWRLSGAGLMLFAVAGAAYAEPAPEQLNWYSRAQLTEAQQADLPAFCSGRYLPSSPVSLAPDTLIAESDEAFLDRQGNANMQGNVEMLYGTSRLEADNARWQSGLQQASFEGNIRLDNADVVVTGSSAGYQAELDDQGTSELILQQSHYALPANHMRGSARHFSTRSDGVIQLKGATVTWCEPGQNDWRIAASEINLDQQRGVGSAWNTRLEVMGVPVFYLPYYRFPIDDRRATGFLDPSFSIGGDAGLQELQTPFYLNLAENLDATLTPHYVNQHGWLWENQLRHKTAWLGDGELNYAYLNQDATEQTERWLVNYQQRGSLASTLGAGWSHQWLYNHVSDDDYLSDFNSGFGIDRSTHLPRLGELRYQQQGFRFALRGEGFQTIDDTIALADRPYRRLPQIDIDYDNWQSTGLLLSGKLQATRFDRDQHANINDSKQRLSGFDAITGDRYVADGSASWRYQTTWSYIEPGIDYRYRYYQLDSDDPAYAVDPVIQHGQPRYHVDSGMTLVRPLNWLGEQQQQTLEPRLFWVQSPYIQQQNAIPAFDTKVTSTSYDSLFTGDRFTGYDRLADLNQLSVGVSSRIIDSHGDEWLRLSLGRVYFGGERRVQLDADEVNDSRATSSTLAEFEWRPGQAWGIYNTLEWDTYGDFARQRRLGLRFNPETNRMLNLSVNKVQSEDTAADRLSVDLYQADLNGFWAVNDSWALTGRVLQDMKSYRPDERRPENPILESLLGFEYQNCCWRFQLLYKHTSPTADDDDRYSTETRKSLMFSIQLKGLTTLGGGTDASLRNSIQGYTRRQYHDY